MSSMVLSRMDTATNASSSTPQRQGSGRTPSRSPTVGTSAPEPLPAGIVGTGGTEQSGDHMLTLGAHFRTGLWEWHPTLSYQLNHRKELDVVGPDSLTEENEIDYTRLDLSLRSSRFDIRASRSGEGGWDWTLGPNLPDPQSVVEC